MGRASLERYCRAVPPGNDPLAGISDGQSGKELLHRESAGELVMRQSGGRGLLPDAGVQCRTEGVVVDVSALCICHVGGEPIDLMFGLADCPVGGVQCGAGVAWASDWAA